MTRNWYKRLFIYILPEKINTKFPLQPLVSKAMDHVSSNDIIQLHSDLNKWLQVILFLETTMILINLREPQGPLAVSLLEGFSSNFRDDKGLWDKIALRIFILKAPKKIPVNWREPLEAIWQCFPLRDFHPNSGIKRDCGIFRMNRICTICIL